MAESLYLSQNAAWTSEREYKGEITLTISGLDTYFKGKQDAGEETQTELASAETASAEMTSVEMASEGDTAGRVSCRNGSCGSGRNAGERGNDRKLRK